MNGIFIVVAGVVAFTLIVLALVAIILAAKATLIPGGNVKIEINDDPEKTIEVPTGGKLLDTLASRQIFVPSACGGGATCGQCKVRVLSGGGEILPTEVGQMTRRELKQGVRLACQTPVKQDMKIEIPPEVFAVKRWECVVRSNEFVATFIKELVLELPEGEDVMFKAGGYVQAERPVGLRIAYKDYDVPEKYRSGWDKLELWDYVSETTEPVLRAYSLASHPLEKGIVKLNIRVAVPPRDNPTVEPGKVSSYLFSLKPGDKVTISGPYGDFLVRDTPSEKIYIGRGAGMAPLRSHIYDMLKRLGHTGKISFWYSARSLDDVFYVEDFQELEKEYPNFKFHLSLYRDPRPGDVWTGAVGQIEDVLYNDYLKDHRAPEDCEYFMCGPAKMTQAILKLLDNLGVERESIFFDDFGN